MHPKSDNKEIMINDEVDEVIKELSDSLKIDIKKNWNHWKVKSLIIFIYCIVNVII